VKKFFPYASKATRGIEKNRPKFDQIHCCQNYYKPFSVEKVAQKIGLLLYIIFENLPKENNRPISENSPNQATQYASKKKKCIW
jgi:hypothetical protein